MRNWEGKRIGGHNRVVGTEIGDRNWRSGAVPGEGGQSLAPTSGAIVEYRLEPIQ